MGTTADKLEYLQGTKTAIKQAIVNKGVAVPDGTTFREYATKISAIQDVSSLPTQGAKTVTPTTSEQTVVASGTYTTGDVKVAGDENLTPENIAEGVSIFGVTGVFNGESVETVTGTFARDGFKVYYAGGDGQTHHVENVMSISDVRKGSIVYCEDTKNTSPSLEITGDIEEIFSIFMFYNSTSVFIANGDFAVE